MGPILTVCPKMNYWSVQTVIILLILIWVFMIGSNSLPLVPTTVPPTCDVAFNFIFNIFKFMVAQLTYIPCPGSVQCAVCIIILYICCQRQQALQNSIMPLYIYILHRASIYTTHINITSFIFFWFLIQALF